MARRLRGHTSRRQLPINLLLPIHWVSRRLTCLVRAGEHLYHLASDGAPVRLPSQLRDAAFDSWTCIYGWPVQGCWPALSGDLDRDRTVDVAAADRARTTPLLANEHAPPPPCPQHGRRRRRHRPRRNRHQLPPRRRRRRRRRRLVASSLRPRHTPSSSWRYTPARLLAGGRTISST